MLPSALQLWFSHHKEQHLFITADNLNKALLIIIITSNLCDSSLWQKKHSGIIILFLEIKPITCLWALYYIMNHPVRIRIWNKQTLSVKWNEIPFQIDVELLMYVGIAGCRYLPWYINMYVPNDTLMIDVITLRSIIK